MNPQGNVDRRTVLKSLTGSITGLGAFQTSVFAKSETSFSEVDLSKEVPYIGAHVHTNPDEVSNGSPPKRKSLYQTAPRWKWEKVEAAHSAAQDLVDSIESRVGKNNNVRVTVTTANNGEKSSVYAPQRSRTPQGQRSTMTQTMETNL